jgi:hemerythrin-like domain-containing protein
MLMGDLLTAALAPDFDEPINLLKACHQRILGFCDLLKKMIKHADVHGIDNEVNQAAQKIHRYFSTAGQYHTEDEEQDLFPMLMDSSPETAAIIDKLREQHIAIHSIWVQLAPVLSRPTLIDETPKFEKWVNAFCDAYREHIQIEETELFAVAEQILGAEQVKQLGKNMKARRENTR